MANTLRFKRGLVGTIPTALAGEPLFTTDTFDLYIGNGTGNTRFQKYIASGATTQILRGDGSLYTFPLAISSPSNGQVLKYNGTSWVNDSDAGITGSLTTNYLPKATGATTLGNSVIFDNGTNVGISTTTLSSKFNIASTNTRLEFGESGSVTFLEALNSVRSTSVDLHIAAKITRFYTRPSGIGTFVNEMTLTDNGRLLIGSTTDSGEKLQVTGTAKITGATTIGGTLNLVTNTWHTSSDARQRIYFEASSITYIKGDGVRLRNNSDVDALIIAPSTAATFASSVTATSFNGATTNVFTVGGTQYMALTSTGLSIGSAFSPDSKLHVLTGGGTPTNQFRINYNNTNDNYIDAANHYWRSGDGSVLRLLLNSSGNLGLGVTPSAWASTAKAIQVGTTGSLWSGSGLTNISHNYYFNGTQSFYLTSSHASAYQQTSGQHIWYNAPSGTAGNAITFTQAMTLDASGRLGIGTTSPLYKLDVKGGNASTLRLDNDGSQYVQLLFERNTTANSGGDILLDGTNGTLGIRTLATYALTFSTAASAGTSQERMRIFSATGNLSIGSTSDTGEKLQVTGTAKITGQTTVTTSSLYPFIATSSGVTTTLVIDNTNANLWGGVFAVRVNGSDKNYFGTLGSLVGSTNYDATIWATSGNGFRVYTNGFNKQLEITTTGAATFSSSVTALTGFFGGALGVANQRVANFKNTNGNGYIEIQGSGTAAAQILSTANGDFYVATGGTAGTYGTTRLLIDNTGAATFYNNLIVDTNTLFVDATNNRVGIGTASPSAKLQFNFQSNDDEVIRTSVAYSSLNAQRGGITWHDGTGFVGKIWNEYDGTNTKVSIGGLYGGGVYNGGAILTVNGNGNVGIGTQSPIYKLDVSGSARVSDAIAIGTTPDTSNPFKILKNINATVGIKFENTNTSSSAFSAVQLGTDVTGGTKFTNLVYASSGVTASGVYNPDGTSLINNGNGGLNFLGNPIRMYTGGSNGVLRWDISNEGIIQYNATSPTTSATDAYKQYSADVTAGNAAPHFRTENGAVIKLYQETTAVGNSIISLGGGNAVLDDTTFDGYTLRQIVKALRNQGILA